jgi:hypothetical protein
MLLCVQGVTKNYIVGNVGFSPGQERPGKVGNSEKSVCDCYIA